MRKVSLTPVLIVVLLFCCAGLLSAEHHENPDDLRTYEGTLTAVDQSRSLVTITGPDARIFKVSSRTSLLKNGFPIELSDLNNGDYVTVSYNETGETPEHALSLDVKYQPGTEW